MFLTSIVLGVLRSALRAGEYLTETEIRHRIPPLSRIRDFDYEYEYYFRRFRNNPDWVLDVLSDLHALGLVERGGTEQGAPADGIHRWGLRPGWMTEDHDGGRDGGQPPRGGDDNERPGDGSLREVLAHRYLFALSDEDFDTVLENALEE